MIAEATLGPLRRAATRSCWWCSYGSRRAGLEHNESDGRRLDAAHEVQEQGQRGNRHAAIVTDAAWAER